MTQDGCFDVIQELAALRAVFDSLVEHVAVLDREGIIVDVNTAWRRFVAANGGNADAIVGTNYLQVCDTAQGRFCAEAGRMAHGLREILAGKEQEFHLEYPCHSPTEKRWFLVYARPWMQEGQIAGVVVSHIPITQRKLAEFTMHYYERTIASAPSLMSIVDSKYTYILVNDSYLRYHGCKRQDIEGHTVPEVMGMEAFIKFIRPHFDRCLSGETVQYEAWFNMAGMGKRYMHVTYYPYREEDNSITGIVVVAQDETQRRILEEEVNRTAQLLEEAQGLAHVGSFDHHLILEKHFWSDELYRILGYTPGAFPPQLERFIEHIHPEDRSHFLHEMGQEPGENPLRYDLRIQTLGGEERWVALSLACDRQDGVVSRIHGAVADITERRLAELRLQELAATDQLTGLANRRRFFEWLEEEVQRAERFGRPLCAAMVDVDHFKNVNDTYGHGVGDLVLAAVGRILREGLRAVDLVARVGGEEFAILLPETDAEVAVRILDRIRKAVAAQEMVTDEASLSVTVSCGVAARQTGELGDALLFRADAALYTAKAAGRNQVRLAQDADPLV